MHLCFLLQLLSLAGSDLSNCRAGIGNVYNIQSPHVTDDVLVSSAEDAAANVSRSASSVFVYSVAGNVSQIYIAARIGP